MAAVRSKLLLVLVAVVSLLAGIAITGIPESVPDDVISSQIAAPASTSTTTAAARTTSTTTATTTTTTETTSTTPTTSSTAPSAAATTVAVGTTTTLVAESALRVVVVNAGGPAGIATRTANDLRAGGYATVVTADALRPQPSSVVAFAPGFEAEARRLAVALGMTTSQVVPRTVEQISANDRPSDLLVLLGADRG